MSENLRKDFLTHTVYAGHLKIKKSIYKPVEAMESDWDVHDVVQGIS